MKKEEIKRDIIREKLISSLHYLSENTYILWSTVIGLSFVIFIVTYITGKNNSNLLDDNTALGQVLINKIYESDSNDSLMLNKFNTLLDGAKTKEGYNTAFIYIVNKAVLDNNIDIVKSMLLNNNFSSDDDMFNAYIYKIKADVLYKDDIDNAIAYNEKAIYLVPNYDLKVSYSFDLIDLLISINKLEDAIEHFNYLELLLKEENLPIATKNDLDFLNFKLKQLLKK